MINYQRILKSYINYAKKLEKKGAEIPTIKEYCEKKIGTSFKKEITLIRHTMPHLLFKKDEKNSTYLPQ